MNRILSPSEVQDLIGSGPRRLSTIDALIFAQKAHFGQVRKFTHYPYVTHCFEVMCILEDHGVQDGDVLCAGMLHDTIEDTSITHADIQSVFGQRVADIVVMVTNVSKKEDGNRQKRKEMDLDHLSKASTEGKMVKLADVISNTMTVSLFDQEFAKTYLSEKKRLLRVLETDHPLYNTAVLTVQRSLFALHKGGKK